jgi:hypothetical protein
MLFAMLFAMWHQFTCARRRRVQRALFFCLHMPGIIFSQTQKIVSKQNNTSVLDQIKPNQTHDAVTRDF